MLLSYVLMCVFWCIGMLCVCYMSWCVVYLCMCVCFLIHICSCLCICICCVCIHSFLFDGGVCCVADVCVRMCVCVFFNVLCFCGVVILGLFFVAMRFFCGFSYCLRCPWL